MIPAFLRAVSAQVRDLAKTGCAVHVTEADAIELEMIAGLDWPQPGVSFGRVSGSAVGSGGMIDTIKDMTISGILAPMPADLALGWLRGASCLVAVANAEIGLPAKAWRSAVCAEMAAICVMLDKEPSYLPFAGDCGPWEGTIEGARAAWEFVAAQLELDYKEAVRIGSHPRVLAQTKEQFDLGAKYRRELEGMK